MTTFIAAFLFLVEIWSRQFSSSMGAYLTSIALWKTAMIIKNLTRKRSGGALIEYIFRYMKQEREGKAQPFIIRHNVYGHDIKSFIEQFNANAQRRLHHRIDQPAIHHTILSWSNRDTTALTPAMIKDLAKKYIMLRGAANLYVGTIHNDRAHTHLHLAMSATQLSGKSSRISREQFANVKVQLDEYQRTRYPELTHSLPDHGSKQRQAELIPTMDRRNNRLSKKEQALRDIHLAGSAARSQEAFENALRAMGYEPYHRSGTLTGIAIESGCKFRFRSLGYDMERINAFPIREHPHEELSKLEAIRCRATARDRELGPGSDMQQPGMPRVKELERMRDMSEGVRGLVLE